MNLIPYAIFLIMGMIIGLIINDIPYFTLNTKIRPFEALTFCAITVFGYWFQLSQKKSENMTSTNQKLIENSINEACDQINKLTSILEEELGNELPDNIKRVSHQYLRNISFNVVFIQKKTDQQDIESVAIQLKETVANDEFSLSSFTVSANYFRDLSNKANELKIALRESLYKSLEQN